MRWLANQVRWRALRAASWASRGVHLGFSAGFTSADTMVYLHADVPTARAHWGAFGRWLDRRYLRSPGAAALRRRRHEVQALVRQWAEAVEPQKSPGQGCVLDIGGGDGSLVAEALPVSWVSRHILMDADPAALASWQRRCGHGPEATATINARASAAWPSASLVVMSGVLELCEGATAADLLRRARACVAADSGRLIWTTLTDHPHLDLVKRCVEHDRQRGRPAEAVRCRSVADLAVLLASCGWSPRAATVSSWGGMAAGFADPA